MVVKINICVACQPRNKPLQGFKCIIIIVNLQRTASRPRELNELVAQQNRYIHSYLQ